MSMFNDIEWTKEGNTETCLHNAKAVAAFATQFKQDIGASWRPSQKIRGGTEIPTNLKDIFPTRYFQQQSHYRLNSWGNEEATAISKEDSTTRSFSSRP